MASKCSMLAFVVGVAGLSICLQGCGGGDGGGENTVSTTTTTTGSPYCWSRVDTPQAVQSGVSLRTATVFDSKVFVFWYDDAGNKPDILNTFDGHKWSGADLPPGKVVGGSAATVFDSKLYLIGGETQLLNSSTAISTVQMFDGSTWSSTSSLLQARTRARAASGTVRNIGERLFVVGGSNRSQLSLKTVEMFDGHKWSSAPPLPIYISATTDFGLAVFDGKLLVAGLFVENGDEKGPGVHIFDGLSWKYESVHLFPPFHRGFSNTFSLASYDSKLFSTWKSSSEKSPGKAVEIFDGSSWCDGPSMNFSAELLVAFDSKLFAFGNDLPHIHALTLCTSSDRDEQSMYM